MIEPAELFVKLTCELENMHALAIEGQVADNPSELLLVLANQSYAGVQLCGEIIAQIKISVGAA